MAPAQDTSDIRLPSNLVKFSERIMHARKTNNQLKYSDMIENAAKGAGGNA